MTKHLDLLENLDNSTVAVDAQSASLLGVRPKKPRKVNGYTNVIASSDIHIDPKEFFTALGEADQRFYFLAKKTQRIMSFVSRDLRSGNAPRDLVPDEAWWGVAFGGKPDKAMWGRIGDYLVNACYVAGYFSMSRVRARGVWMDEGRVVAHVGHEVWLDSEVVAPIAMADKSKFIYPLQQSLIDTSERASLTDDEGLAFVALCRKLDWANKFSGELLAGLIATSHICGAIKFRTHGWITGPTHSGKSWVLREIVMRALGSVAINILGNSTEAGIRQEVSIDARPVVYDEAEGRGSVGKIRREFIIELMRAASAETDGQVLKGGAGHKAQGFRIKTQFILASIGVGLTERADETRTIVLTLRNPADHASAAAVAEHFLDLQQASSALGDNLAPKMFRRMAGLVKVVRINAEKFRVAIAKVHDSRTGDQVGTILAGVAALTVSRELTDDEVADRLSHFSWDTYTPPKDEKDESALLSVLAARQLTVETEKLRLTRTIAELCLIASMDTSEDVIKPEVARSTIERHGLKFERWSPSPDIAAADGIWIVNKHPELERIFSSSPYSQGHARILSRVGGAHKSPDPLRFAGRQGRATWVPLYQLTGDPKPD